MAYQKMLKGYDGFQLYEFVQAYPWKIVELKLIGTPGESGEMIPVKRQVKRVFEIVENK